MKVAGQNQVQRQGQDPSVSDSIQEQRLGAKAAWENMRGVVDQQEPNTPRTVEEKIRLNQAVSRFIESTPSDADRNRASQFVASHFKPSVEVSGEIKELVRAYEQFNAAHGFYFNGNFPHEAEAEHGKLLERLASGKMSKQDLRFVEGPLANLEGFGPEIAGADPERYKEFTKTHGAARVGMVRAAYQAIAAQDSLTTATQTLKEFFKSS